MKRLLSLMLLLGFATSAAFAEAESSVGQAIDAPKPEKKICRTEAMTGSLTRKTRVCMTPAQWDKLSADTGKAVEDMNRYQARPDRQPQNPQAGQGF